MKRHWNRSSAGYTLADMLAVVVLIPLAGAVLLGCYQHSHGNNSRVKCAANLKAIGQALLLYANDNKNQYPYAAYTPGEKVIPTWGTPEPQPNDVSAAIFLLINKQELSAEVFVCPSSQAERWDYGGGNNTSQNWKNWQSKDDVSKYLSYSMQNPYADDAAVKRGFLWDASRSSEYAVFADINPGKDVFSVTLDSPSEKMKKANSPNHAYAGQQILYGDGHVDWAATPFAGVNSDNIYARRAGPEGSASSVIVDSPYDKDDNVLLPTFE